MSPVIASTSFSVAGTSTTGRSAGLWAGIVGSSTLWAMQLQICYGSVPVLCELHALWVSHVVSLICFAGTIFCALLSYRDWASADRASPDQTDGGPQALTRFLGVLGLALSSVLALTILAQGLAAFFFDPCWA